MEGTGTILRRNPMSFASSIKVVLPAALLAVALSMPAPVAAKDSLPERAVYTDPGPVPPPDSVAKRFVDRNAPSLGGMTTDDLARGVVVAEPSPSGKPRSGAANGAPRPSASAPGSDPTLLERAGVTSGTTPLDPLVGVVVAAFLAAFGVVVLAFAPPRDRARSGALR